MVKYVNIENRLDYWLMGYSYRAIIETKDVFVFSGELETLEKHLAKKINETEIVEIKNHLGVVVSTIKAVFKGDKYRLVAERDKDKNLCKCTGNEYCPEFLTGHRHVKKKVNK